MTIVSRDSMCSNLSLRRQESTRCLYIGNSVIFCLMSPKTGPNNELLYACLASTFGVAWLNSCKPMLGTTTGLGNLLAAWRRLVARLVAGCCLASCCVAFRLVGRLVDRLDLLCRTILSRGFVVVKPVWCIERFARLLVVAPWFSVTLAAALDSAKALRYASIYSLRACAARSDMACTKHKPNAFLCSTRFK